MNERRPASSVTAAIFSTIAGCFVCAALMCWSVPSLWYLPLARAWHFGAKPATLAMSWYGRTLWVFASALVGAAIGKVVPWSSARFTKLSSAVAYLAVVTAVIACVVVNLDRPTKPIASPTGEPVVCVRAP